MKKTLLILLLTASVCYSKNSMNVITGVISDSENATSPVKTVTSASDSYMVKYDFSSLDLAQDDLYTSAYQCSYPGFGQTHTTGFASLPIIVDQYALPDGKRAVVSITDSIFTDYNLEVAPARPFLWDDDEVYTVSNVPPVTANNSFTPQSLVELSQMLTYRGTNIARVSCCPIQYNSLTKTARIFSSITYKVSFVDIPATRGLTDTNAYYNAYDDVVLTDLKGTGELSYTGTDISKDYLILTTPDYYTAASNFASWKRNLGFNVSILKDDDWTYASAKEAVDDFFASHPRLYALLIIGSNSDVPSKLISETSKYKEHLSDMYFACLDGEDDLMPDILYGRLDVSTASDANIAVSKIIGYEKTPTSNSSFYKTGTNAAYFQTSIGFITDPYTVENRRFVQTSEEIRSKLLAKGYNVNRAYYAHSTSNPKTFYNGTAMPTELQKPNYAWDADSTTIINAINNKSFYVLCRTHGNHAKGWQYPNFGATSFNFLSNKDYLPVVFSITCDTGNFLYDNYFAKDLLNYENGGSVGVLAASQNSLSTWNDNFANELFNSLFAEGITSSKYESTSIPQLGDAISTGLNKASSYCDNNDANLYQREVFHYFGDPTMRLYTTAPTNFKNVYVVKTDNTINVTLDSEKAIITFYNRSTNEVVAYNDATASFYSKNASNIDVCISAPNKRPVIINSSNDKSQSNDEVFDISTSGIISCVLNGSSSLGVEYVLNGSTSITGSQLILLDTNGNIYANQTLSPNEHYTTIDVSSLTSGTYILALSGSNSSIKVYIP